MFRYWRGGLCYHFRIVKTPFHSGRIRVTWSPTSTYQSTVTKSHKTMLYQQVFDIRDRSDFSIQVPWVANVPWYETTYTKTADVYQGATLGQITIEVLNSLQRPSTAGDSIRFIVETTGGDDFQFAVPYANKDIAVLERAPSRLATVSRQAIAQVNDDECIPLFKTSNMEPVDACATTIGEVCTSLRQVLKRYEPMYGNDQAVLKSTNFTALNCHGITSNGSTAPLVQTNYNRIAMLYRFWSGTLRVLFELTAKSSTGRGTYVSLMTKKTTDLTYPTSTDDDQRTSGRSTTISNPNHEPIVEVEIPFYNMTPVQLTDVGSPVLTQTINSAQDTVQYNTGSYISINTNDNSYLPWRAIGEDFSFGYLIGPPITQFV